MFNMWKYSFDRTFLKRVCSRHGRDQNEEEGLSRDDDCLKYNWSRTRASACRSVKGQFTTDPLLLLKKERSQRSTFTAKLPVAIDRVLLQLIRQLPCTSDLIGLWPIGYQLRWTAMQKSQSQKLLSLTFKKSQSHLSRANTVEDGRYNISLAIDR